MEKKITVLKTDVMTVLKFFRKNRSERKNKYKTEMLLSTYTEKLLPEL